MNYIQRLRIYDNFSDQAFNKLFDKLFRILKSQGAGALVKASAEELSEELRLTAFACAVDIALADGVLEDSEKDIINQLASALAIPENTAVSIIEVMLIKKQGIARLSGSCTRQPPTVLAAAAPSRRQAKVAEIIRKTKTSIPPALAGMDAAF